MNQVMDVNDLANPEWQKIVATMHDLMRVPDGKKHSFKHCTDRRGLFNRAEIESFKHWEYPWLLSYGDFKPGMRVLDCGCGRGVIQVYLSRLGLRVSSVDVSTMKPKLMRKFWTAATNLGLPLQENKAAAMQRFAKRYGCELDFHCASIAQLPFQNEAFDRVYSISVLEHMEEGDDEKAMQEMARVVKRGGLVLVTVDFSPVKIPRKSYDAADIERLIKKSGLVVEGSKSVNFEIKDWEAHKQQLQWTFEKSNVEVTTAGFILRKPL